MGPDMFFRLDEVLAFRHELTSESDRGCALMAAAYLDDQLSLLLKARLIDDPEVAEQLFGHVGALGTFSSRIVMAYMLGLLGDTARRDLNLIRKVRNEFGHVAAPITFDHPPVASRCRELHYHSRIAGSSRAIFVQTVLGITAVIHAELLGASRPASRPDRLLTGELKVAQRERQAALLKILEAEADKLDWSSEEAYLASLKRLVLLSSSPLPPVTDDNAPTA